MNDANPINPQRVFWELSPRLPDNAILSSDSGSAANWYARDLKIRRGMMASLSGTLATMGPGVPYAIAAKFAYPDRPAIALVGDGAMQMNGNNELITVAKYWKEWKDPRLVILVLNNHDLNQVTWEQRAMVGDPKLHGLAGPPRLPLRRLRRVVRAARHPGRQAGADRARLGAGLPGRSPGRRRGDHRSGRPAAAAAHHLQAGEGNGVGGAQGGRRLARDRPADVSRDGRELDDPTRTRGRRCPPQTSFRSPGCAGRTRPAGGAAPRPRGLAGRAAAPARRRGPVRRRQPRPLRDRRLELPPGADRRRDPAGRRTTWSRRSRSAASHGAPLLSRGGGTSLTGSCCNVAVVMDWSKYLNTVLAIDPASEAGAGPAGDGARHPPHQAANAHDLTFAPDPSTHTHNTLGGMIGNNSCGVHSLMGLGTGGPPTRSTSWRSCSTTARG